MSRKIEKKTKQNNNSSTTYSIKNNQFDCGPAFSLASICANISPDIATNSKSSLPSKDSNEGKRETKQSVSSAIESNENEEESEQSKDIDLAGLREDAENNLERTKESRINVKLQLSSAKDLVNTLLATVEEKITAPRTTPEDVLEDIFKAFFDAVEANNSDVYDQAVLRLLSLEYPDTNLMKKYIRSKKGSTRDELTVNEVACECEKLKQNDWAKAKMLIELLDIENAPIDLLRKLTTSLRGDILTGKEQYALALLESDLEQRKALLMASLLKGYSSAGKALMTLVPQDDDDAQNMTLQLARHLIPEACLEIGKKESDTYLKERDAQDKTPITIDAPCMLYYKLAASQDSDEALLRIADILFDTSFKDVCFISKKPEDQQATLKENATIIWWIANILMGKRIETAHLAEISGIALFSLNDKKFYAEARKRLFNLKQRSAAANYCLGYMSEHGYGCVKNFTSAVKYYKKALGGGLLTANKESINRQLSNAEKKLSKQFKARMEAYNNGEDYSGSSETTSYSSGGMTMVFLVALGLGYQSEALKEMRSFRDTEICCSPAGKRLVDEYYRLGPAIWQCIEQSGDAKGTCEQLWKDYVKDIQQAVKDGNTQDAIHKMIDMQVELYKKYKLPYDESLVKEYMQENASKVKKQSDVSQS